MNKKQNFRHKLLDWFSTHHRPLPWKGELDPYVVWLSEIILQQTTVAQGTAYFEKFKARYPSVSDLAKASDDEVMKMWEGLGYYSRARNLHATAKFIANDLNGQFPTTYAEILKLKGVGTYTAAAIASFAYSLPHAVVDGNVYRVLARVFGIETPIDSLLAKKEFSNLAAKVLDETRAADFNQAIMDFGATHCTPNNPKCKGCCPMLDICVAYATGKVGVLPIKSKKLEKRTRYFNYLVLNTVSKDSDGEGSVFIRKRVDKDIWQGLNEFPLIETDGLVGKEAVILRGSEMFNLDLEMASFQRQSKVYQQLLTHQKVIATFWEFNLDSESKMAEILRAVSFVKTERENLATFAFPKIIDSYLKEKVLSLF